MPDVTVSVDRVSKRYRLHRGWHGSLRTELAASLRRLVRREQSEQDVY
jgi:hypothetical protein